MERKVGYEIKVLSNMMKRHFDCKTPIVGEEHITGMQGWIIKYIYDQQDTPVFQRDIEQVFSIRRSTATGILKLMEKNQLIKRESVDSDARLKKLTLTSQAIEVRNSIENNIAILEQQFVSGLTQEELNIFFGICDKLKKNLEQDV